MALAVCLAAVAGAFLLWVPLGILALAAAVPVAYLFYKPMIPTPAPNPFRKKGFLNNETTTYIPCIRYNNRCYLRNNKTHFDHI